MTILDAVEADLRNIGAVLDSDRSIREELRTAARLGGKTNEEIVMLRGQIAFFANAVIENGAEILGLAE